MRAANLYAIYNKKYRAFYSRMESKIPSFSISQRAKVWMKYGSAKNFLEGNNGFSEDCTVVNIRDFESFK